MIRKIVFAVAAALMIGVALDFKLLAAEEKMSGSRTTIDAIYLSKTGNFPNILFDFNTNFSTKNLVLASVFINLLTKNFNYGLSLVDNFSVLTGGFLFPKPLLIFNCLDNRSLIADIYRPNPANHCYDFVVSLPPEKALTFITILEAE